MLVDSSIGPTFFRNIRTSLLNFTRTYDDSRVEDFRLWSGEVLKFWKLNWTLAERKEDPLDINLVCIKFWDRLVTRTLRDGFSGLWGIFHNSGENGLLFFCCEDLDNFVENTVKGFTDLKEIPILSAGNFHYLGWFVESFKPPQICCFKSCATLKITSFLFKTHWRLNYLVEFVCQKNLRHM